MLPREYAREAFKRGLAYETSLGANPFKFGVVGSTDAHTSLPTTQEDNFFGKVVLLEPSRDPIRFEEVVAGRPAPKGFQSYARNTSASGLAGVWARDNTRESLWDAMSRKEVFATTGTRLQVRVFGGFGFTAADLDRSDFAGYGYAHGVPMGGDLKPSAAATPPTFLVRAMRDTDGANLDRVQMVKGWLDASGRTHERVYDLAWSGTRRRDPKSGKVPPVGNTVNVEGGDVLQRDRRAGPAGVLAGPRLRPRAARVLLRTRARDPDATLDDLRRKGVRCGAARRCAGEHSGTGVHHADLVYARCRRVGRG